MFNKALLILFSIIIASFCEQKLQIHFIDVGNADGIVIVTPQNENILIDGGGNCQKCLLYLTRIGIKNFDYVISSHYHSDHIGCTKKILTRFPIKSNGTVYDRGEEYKSSTFNDYVEATGGKRKTVKLGSSILLDNDNIRIDFVAMNGDGIETNNENDLSLVAVLHYGKFDLSLGGDLSGKKEGDYEDIESGIADRVGRIEVYKVHHHCSEYSSNDKWLSIIQPKVGIICVGDKNRYDHPADGCIERLHNSGIDLYWTETGAGMPPDTAYDKIWGNIVVEVDEGGEKFTVKGPAAKSKTYDSWSDNAKIIKKSKPSTESVSTIPKFAWSIKSRIYHVLDCKFVSNISPDNRMEGNDPPQGKEPHECVNNH